MHQLKNITTEKLVTINYQASIKEAMRIMYDNKNGCVVLIKKQRPVGIITESDIVNGFKNDIKLEDKALKIATTNLYTADESRPLDFAFSILNQHNIRRIIIINKEKKYIGTVLQDDLFSYIEEDVYKEDLKISNIIDNKKNILKVNEKSSINDVIIKMRKLKVGSLIVEENGKNVGIITEKDILKLRYKEVNLEETVSIHMSSPLITINKNTYITDAIEYMKAKHIRRVVVVDENSTSISLLTNRDILKQIKGNYTRILENKIKHAQEIMNFLPEPIIEIYYLNNNSMIHWVNTQAKNLFGKGIIDKDISDIIDKKDWEEIKNTLISKKMLKNKTIGIREKTFEISGTLSKNLETSYIKLIFKDVTNYEKQKKELQNLVNEEIKKRQDSQYLLMQQSKLATMGEMIGHIAHQWRQPLGQLGGIFMNLESAYDFKELDKQYLDKKIEHGNDLIKYMSNTIEDFRNFFTPSKDKEEFCLEKSIDNAINIINASLTYNHISLDFQRKDEQFKILGSQSEFSQVILNILANAQDALVENNIQDPKIKIKLAVKKDDIFIKIYDNAGGINENIIDKIFNIYFTTKSKNEGSGLGLYMSKLIIQSKFDGIIKAKNTEKGVRFTIKMKLYKNNY